MSGSGVLDFSILGRAFHVTGAPPPLADWLHAHWDFPEHAVAPHAYTISLDVRDAPPSSVARPVGTPVAVTVQGITLNWHSTRSTWWLDAPDGGLSLTVGPSSSRVDAWGRWEGDAAPALYPALYLALSESLRASGLLPLHTAAAARDGLVTLFLGQSGTGKSTTVLRAAEQGWTPLAEDTVWLDPTPLFVAGWDRGIRLWPEGRDRFAASLTNARWRPDAGGKLVLDYGQFGGTAARHGTLARIAVLAREESRAPGWEPLAPHEIVRALWEATGVPLVTDTRTWVARVISSLLPRVECRRLWIGPAPLPL
jgi:hypothetical protein